MITLIGEHVYLRALEPEDINYLYDLENDENLWKVSSTIAPFSRALLTDYIANSHRDIYEIRQLRLVICEKNFSHAVGLIDLFDFDPQNRRVAVGITIYPEKERGKGYALEALECVTRYAFEQLQVHQIYAGITENNQASISLFEKAKFIMTGRKKDWTFEAGSYHDELIYQLFRSA